MRTSPDYFRLFDGQVVAVWQDSKPPVDSILIYGYDYNRQKWVLNGKKLVEKLLENKVIKILK